MKFYSQQSNFIAKSWRFVPKRVEFAKYYCCVLTIASVMLIAKSANFSH